MGNRVSGDDKCATTELQTPKTVFDEGIERKGSRIKADPLVEGCSSTAESSSLRRLRDLVWCGGSSMFSK